MTTNYEAANAALDGIESTLTEAGAEVRQRVADARKAVDGMQADLDAATKPPPVVVVSNFGTSKPDQTSPGTTALPVAGYRTYLSPGQKPPSLAADNGTRAAYASVASGGVVWLSIKDEAGLWLDNLLADALAKYPGITTLLTADHEPKDGWWDTGRMAEWSRRQGSLEAVAWDRPGVELWTVVEGSALADKSAGDAYFSACLREKQGFGMDSYNPGIQTCKQYVDPAEIHGPRFQWVKDHGKAVTAVGETGTGLVTGDTNRTGQTKWLDANRAYMLSGAVLPVRSALWWNSGSNGPMKTGCRLTSVQMERWLGR